MLKFIEHGRIEVRIDNECCKNTAVLKKYTTPASQMYHDLKSMFPTAHASVRYKPAESRHDECGELRKHPAKMSIYCYDESVSAQLTDFASRRFDGELTVEVLTPGGRPS